MADEPPPSDALLGLFLVRLAAALNAADLPVDDLQRRVEAVGAAHGVPSVRTSAFPTFVMVSMAGGEPVSLEDLHLIAMGSGMDAHGTAPHAPRSGERRASPSRRYLYDKYLYRAADRR